MAFSGTEQKAMIAAALGAAALVALSCLPDLVVIPPPPPTCGDGVVDLDRGEECDPGDAGPLGGNGCTAGCTVACDGGFVDPKSSHCYYWGTPATSKDFAENFCGEPPNGGHVVTFGSADELAYVAARSQEAGVRGGPDASGYTAWSALQLVSQPLNAPNTPSYVNDGELGWGRDCPGCWARIDDPDATVFPPRTDGGATGECATWQKNTKPPWLTTICDLGATVRPVLCEREPTGDFTRPCAGGTCIAVRVTSGKKQYVVTNNRVTADSAVGACQKLGGRLVVLQSREESEELFAAVEGLGVTDSWIGLSRATDTAPWLWEDGTDVSKLPLPWGDREPKATGPARAYAIIDRSRYDTRAAHADDDPNASHPALCER